MSEFEIGDTVRSCFGTIYTIITRENFVTNRGNIDILHLPNHVYLREKVSGRVCYSAKFSGDYTIVKKAKLVLNPLNAFENVIYE